jgi:hypothetical protein
MDSNEILPRMEIGNNSIQYRFLIVIQTQKQKVIELTMVFRKIIDGHDANNR